jgi:hypothetical protein
MLPFISDESQTEIRGEERRVEGEWRVERTAEMSAHDDHVLRFLRIPLKSTPH